MASVRIEPAAMLRSILSSIVLPNKRANFRLFALPLGFAMAYAAHASAPAEVPIGGLLPEATLQGLNGPPRKLSSFRGRPLIINMWASWCGPCVGEMASIERLAWLDRKPHFVVIGISTDDYATKPATLLKNTHATVSHFIDTRLQMENMLGASKLPLTVLVGEDGRILAKICGARAWDTAESLRLIDSIFRKSLHAR